ncbi:MAG: peptide chain release factor N(5)-glutamine methyltransferase [Gammaproteobacteria bacterium]|nr:peptide chain release factor N(5)-glutamine methyltransferase [Gammaproteobacteria bacterium]
MLETIRGAMSWAYELSRGACGELSRTDAEVLLISLLGISRAELKAHEERGLSHTEQRAFKSHMQRYMSGEPVSYITGRQPFWTLDLEVDPSVLIPRPETELLVEAAIEVMPDQHAHVLDLGTGCGAIALALSVERPSWELVAVDRSIEALAVASRNYAGIGERHTIGHVEFRQSDWFSDIERRFDLVIANPPYVALHDPLYEGSGFEPNEALFSGRTGLEALHTIIANSPLHLRPAGWLLVEHGNLQGESVREMMGDAGFYRIETRQDLAGHDRITLASFPLETSSGAWMPGQPCGCPEQNPLVAK